MHELKWKIDDLVTCAINALSNDDKEEYRRCVRELKYIGSKDVLDAVSAKSNSNNPSERIFVVDVLSELGLPEKSYPEETNSVILNMLEAERDETVVANICYALTRSKNIRAVDHLIKLSEHPNTGIRLAVAQALGGYDDTKAIQTLIRLMHDTDNEIQNWATLGVGSLTDIDTPEIRQALWEKANDPDEEIRFEALTGLASRQDHRVIPILIEEMQNDNVEAWVLDVAADFHSPVLLPELLRLKSLDISNKEFRKKLEWAITCCTGE